MKKILFALVALLPLLVSCGKQDRGDNTFSEPRFVQVAGQLIPLNNINALTSLTKADAEPEILQSIEFTESGLYVVGLQKGSKIEYTTGTYTVNGSVYSLAGFGTVELSGTTGSRMATIKYLNGTEETIPVVFLTATDSNVAYRGWTIDKTRVTINGFHAPASADFKGCNFDEMKKFLNENGHKGDYLPSGSLTSVSITGANSIIFAYSDKSADVAVYSFSGTNINFSWQSGSRLLEIENGKGSIDYLDGKCILKLDAALKGSTTSGTVTFVLSSMD